MYSYTYASIYTHTYMHSVPEVAVGGTRDAYVHTCIATYMHLFTHIYIYT